MCAKPDDPAHCCWCRQYVSAGKKHNYVVACPRVACPFDTQVHEMAYPQDFTESLINLGWELSSMTSNFSMYDGTRLQMQVGINSGPVAGALLGKVRRFYNIYGDTINTAARMASKSQNGCICFSEEFLSESLAALLKDGALPRKSLRDFQVTLRGEVEVKGKVNPRSYARNFARAFLVINTCLL
jgi:class 3 adenylate cyclase